MLAGMEITPLPLPSDLEDAEETLIEAGLAFTVVCSGPEPSCPQWQMPQAA